MNLRYYYYHTCFGGVDLRQPPKKSAHRETLDKRNEAILREHGQKLCSAAPPLPRQLPPGNVGPLRRIVQNPGLLPGIGYPHEVGYPGEFKLGFHFDFTTGLPLLPGSSVKGALRAVFPRYRYQEKVPTAFQASDQERNAAIQLQKARFVAKLVSDILIKDGMDLPESVLSAEGAPPFVHRLELALFDGWDSDTLDSSKPLRKPLCRRAVFFDAFPAGYAEIEGQNRLLGRDALTPHGKNPLKNPTPLPFVKVLPGVGFAFTFRLFPIEIEFAGAGKFRISTEAQRELFSRILEKTGIGAKTNVGYGRLSEQQVPMPVRIPAQRDFGRREAQPEQRAAGTASGRTEVTPPTPRPAPKREVKSVEKWKTRDVIFGRVTQHEGKDVLFISEQITEPGWSLIVKNAPLPDKLVIGKTFKLSVSSILSKERLILATVADFTVLDN